MLAGSLRKCGLKCWEATWYYCGCCSFSESAQLNRSNRFFFRFLGFLGFWSTKLVRDVQLFVLFVVRTRGMSQSLSGAVICAT